MKIIKSKYSLNKYFFLNSVRFEFQNIILKRLFQKRKEYTFRNVISIQYSYASIHPGGYLKLLRFTFDDEYIIY